MSTLIIKGGTVVTMTPSRMVIPNGVIRIEDDQITQVDDASVNLSSSDLEVDQVIDASGMAVMPGLVDLHYHSNLGRGLFDNLPLWEWCQQWWHPLLRSLDDETAYWVALIAYAESIRSGTTCVNDMSRHPGSLGKAAAEIGIRAVVANTVADSQWRLDGLEDCIEGYRGVQSLECAHEEFRLGIEAVPMATRELLRDVRDLSQSLGVGVHIHLDESHHEVEQCVERHGQRPTEVAFDEGLLGPNTLAAHAVWVDENERRLLAESGTSVSHNPSANAKLGNGIAPLLELLEAGITVGLGHDGAENNNTRDLFRTMHFAALVHRASRVDASILPAPQVLDMATRAGGAALSLPIGVLASGYKADLICIRLDQLGTIPLLEGLPEQLLSHLVYSVTGAQVNTSVIAGQVVMQAGRLP